LNKPRKEFTSILQMIMMEMFVWLLSWVARLMQNEIKAQII